MFSKKKKETNNILINLLFKSKSLYGESLKNTNKDIIPFIYGIRHNYTIINLKNSLIFLKRIFKLLENCLKNSKKDEKILLIGNSNDIKFLVNKKFIKNNKKIIFFDKDWTNGFITNKIDNNEISKKINFLIKIKKIKLIFVIKSSINDNFLNKELSTLRIPIISVINTDQELKNINYPFVTNTKNIKSLFNLMYLFRKNF